MRWLVVKGAVALLQILRRSAVQVHLVSGLMVLRLRQYQEREDSPMATVVSLPTWKLTHHPVAVPWAVRVAAEEQERLLWPGSQTPSDQPHDQTKPSQPA
jgi:hypothetical protein